MELESEHLRKWMKEEKTCYASSSDGKRLNVYMLGPERYEAQERTANGWVSTRYDDMDEAVKHFNDL